MDANSIAIEFLCPICHTLPVDPVLAEDGFFYSKKCIDEIIRRNCSETFVSPMTGEKIGTSLIFSEIVKSTIKELVESGGVNEDMMGAWRNWPKVDKFDFPIDVTRDLDEKKHIETAGLMRDVQPVLNTSKITASKLEDVKYIRSEILEGMSIENRGNRTEFFANIMDMAEHGHVAQMVTLGRCLLFGEAGIWRDEAEGYEWCNKAAKENSVDGKALSGFCLINGIGVKKDRDEGFERLVDAANDGSDFAAYKLGLYYRTGINGFKMDARRSQKWLGMMSREDIPPYFFCDDFSRGEQKIILTQTKLNKNQQEPSPFEDTDILPSNIFDSHLKNSQISSNTSNRSSIKAFDQESNARNNNTRCLDSDCLSTSTVSTALISFESELSYCGESRPKIKCSEFEKMHLNTGSENKMHDNSVGSVKLALEQNNRFMT